MNYKDALYKSYYTTHIKNRKGKLMADLKKQSFGFNQHFGKLLIRNFDSKIADLGCGSGGLVWWLQKKGYRNIFGVDASEEQVELARDMGIDGVACGDVFTFLKMNNGFSQLFARDLIEHFEKQDVYEFATLCNKALIPEGRLVLQVPNAESPFFGRIRYGDFTHEIAYTPNSVKQILYAVGFKKVHVLPWRPSVFDFKSFTRHIIWRIIEPLIKFPIIVESGGLNRVVTMNLIVVAEK